MHTSPVFHVAQTGPAKRARPFTPWKTTRICITRHGETDWNKRGILQGWLDVPVNDLGLRQASEMAARFAGAGFDAVWTSPLVRASQTAEIIASALQLPAPSSHEGLKERNFGAIQGIPKNELAELNPALLEQILRRNPAADFVGGESMDEFADRVMAALDEIGARHPGERVLVITHGWVMDVVARHVGGQARDAILPMKPQNGQSIWIDAAGQDYVAASNN
ncbi:MAG TPA: histidine phosphatase family protein [Noviherbaspirillum sp.]|nr:histidine phosphatase family protein [Noviherbaspirillum sp.]